MDGKLHNKHATQQMMGKKLSFVLTPLRRHLRVIVDAACDALHPCKRGNRWSRSVPRGAGDAGAPRAGAPVHCAT